MLRATSSAFVLRRALPLSLCCGALACAAVPVSPAPPVSAVAPAASSSAPPAVASAPSATAAATLDPRDAAALPEPIPAERAFTEANAALGIAALGADALDHRDRLTEAARSKLSAAGVGEDQVLGWLQGMAPACRVADGARPETACRGQAGAPDLTARDLFRRVVGASGAVGSLRTARVLVRLHATRSLDATEALGALLWRRQPLRTSAKPCRPPSDERVAEEVKKLDDFLVLQDGAKGLRARALTEAERADLAYFFASIGQAHRPETTARREVTTPSLAADREAQLAALAEGDLEAARKIARASFTAWGLDRSTSGNGAAQDGVLPGSLAPFAFDAGIVFELLGDDAEAARAYRASLGGRAKSAAERPLFGSLNRSEAILRADEATGACGDVVFPRLRRGFLRPAPEASVGRLKEGGFDVLRLLRGGVLTAHRTAFFDPSKSRLTAAQQATYAKRASVHGHEPFDDRGRLLQGLVDEQGADAIPALLATARDKDAGPEDRTRSLAILASLLREPDRDPCATPAPFQPLHAYERSVGSINAVCATRLSNDESKRLATELGQLSTDADKEVRFGAVVAIDAFDRDRASPALKRFLKDAFTVPGAPPQERRPIAVMAERALFRRGAGP